MKYTVTLTYGNPFIVESDQHPVTADGIITIGDALFPRERVVSIVPVKEEETK